MSLYPSLERKRRGNEDSSGDRNGKRIKDLAFLIDQKNEEIKELKRQVKEQKQKIVYQDKDITSLKERIKELEKDVRNLNEEVRILNKELTETRGELREVKESVVSLQGDHNILLIGEVCRRLQANLYQYVFPEMVVSPFYSYKMANLDRDIEKTKSKLVKSKAKKQWEELKQKEDPKRFQDLINELQNLRNISAHPEIKDEIGLQNVTKAAEELKEQGGFDFLGFTDFRFEDVKEVIEMWNRTEEYVKKLKT